MGRRVPWVQPTLEGGAIKAFRIKARYNWPEGWNGAIEIQQEGWASGWIEVSRLTEGDSDSLSGWLELAAAFLGYQGD